MTQALFRTEAIDAGRHRLAGTVVASTPPSASVYTGLLLLVVVAMAALLAFGSYGGGVAVRGLIDYDAGTARVYAPADGEVRTLHVQVGQTVAAGAPLATIGLAQGPHGLGVQIAELTSQIAELDRQIALASVGAAADRTGLEAQAASLASTLVSLRRQRDIAASQITIAEGLVGRSGRLAREGAGTKRQEEEARSALLSQRAGAESLTEKIISTEATLADIRHRLARTGIDVQNTRSELVAKRAALGAQADALRRSDSLVVTSPVAGVVGDIAAQPGQRVSAQGSVATVVPRDGSLQVQLYAPSRAIGFAHVGEQVRLRFDAFPYQRYGALRGTVVAVSPVAVDPTAVAPVLDVHEPVFRVKVRMNTTHASLALRPGMTLSADLLMAPRPLWAVVLGPIRRGEPS